MRNKFFEKRNLTYKYSCNDWTCPCNDGETGCFADEESMNLCDFSDKEFLKHKDNCYDAWLHSKDSGLEDYYKACALFFSYVDKGFEACPSMCWGYCKELDISCVYPEPCDKRLELLLEGVKYEYK